MAKMALGDEPPISHQDTSRKSLNTAVPRFHPSVGHSQMSALSSSELKSVKSDEKAQVNSESIDALLIGDGDVENIQPRSDRRPAMRPSAHQLPLNQTSTANSKTAVSSDVALVNKDENLQTENSDESIRVAALQRERQRVMRMLSREACPLILLEAR